MHMMTTGPETSVEKRSSCMCGQKDFNHGPGICYGERAVSLINGSIKINVCTWKNEIGTSHHNTHKNKLKMG